MSRYHDKTKPDGDIPFIPLFVAQLSCVVKLENRVYMSKKHYLEKWGKKQIKWHAFSWL